MRTSKLRTCRGLGRSCFGESAFCPLPKAAVADTGGGIPPEHLPHVFERFYRADGARSDGAGGSGLGLAIARALVEAHHGQIHLESRVGEGTRAEVVLTGATTRDSRPSTAVPAPPALGTP